MSAKERRIAVSDDTPPTCVHCGETVDWDTMRWIWLDHDPEPTVAVCSDCLGLAVDDHIRPEQQEPEPDVLLWEVRCCDPRPEGFFGAVVVGATEAEALEYALCRCRDVADVAHVLATETLILPLGPAFQRAFRDANSDGGVVCVEYNIHNRTVSPSSQARVLFTKSAHEGSQSDGEDSDE
jgi:hypothetical protein